MRETSVYTGGNVETFDYRMVLTEADVESQSYRLAPDVGMIGAPAIKFSLIQQSEVVTLPPPPPPESEPAEAALGAESEAEAAAQGSPEGEAAATDVAEGAPAAEGEDAAEGDEGKEGDDANADPVEASWVEPFEETRVAGTSTHVVLKHAMAATSSAEALERVARTPARLVRTIEQLLNLTRPISFS